MDYKKLAELLFPNVDKTPEDYESVFPVRELPEGALVTRIGPSPTGFVHLGNLYNAIISAHSMTVSNNSNSSGRTGVLIPHLFGDVSTKFEI